MSINPLASSLVPCLVLTLVASVAKVFRKHNLVCEPLFAIQCSRQLVDAHESPSDLLVQHHVRITLMQRHISDIFSYHSPGNSKIMGEAGIGAAVDSFKRELESLKQQMQENALDSGEKCPLTPDAKESRLVEEWFMSNAENRSVA